VYYQELTRFQLYLTVCSRRTIWYRSKSYTCEVGSIQQWRFNRTGNKVPDHGTSLNLVSQGVRCPRWY